MVRRVLVALSVLVLAACGTRPHTFDVLDSAHVARPAATTTTTTTVDPAVVKVFNVAYFNAAYQAWLAAQPPAPIPVSDARCPAGQVKWLIDWTFGPSAPWNESIAMRESGCDPTAYNPSGAEGVEQLLGHQDLLDAVCPPHGDWRDPSCNVRAAWQLFLADYTAPWRI